MLSFLFICCCVFVGAVVSYLVMFEPRQGYERAETATLPCHCSKLRYGNPHPKISCGRVSRDDKPQCARSDSVESNHWLMLMNVDDRHIMLIQESPSQLSCSIISGVFVDLPVPKPGTTST